MSSSELMHMLQIKNAHKNDSGIVRCAVHSDAGSDIGLPYESYWCTTNLAVVPSVFMCENSQINLSKPRFMSNFGEVRSLGGQTVEVKAPFKSELESTVRWIAAVSSSIFNRFYIHSYHKFIVYIGKWQYWQYWAGVYDTND